MNDPKIDPSAAVLFVQVLRKELADDPAGQEILKRFQKAPAKNSEALAGYLRYKLDTDKQFAERWAKAPDLSTDMRTVITGGNVERIVQIAQAGVVVINQGIPWQVGLIAAIVAAVSLTILVISLIPKPAPPMGDGFNVAVAEFGMVDTNGKVAASEVSRKFSEGIYSTLETEIKRLPSALQVELRGPGDVGVVTDNEKAKQVAERLHATMLIYGRVREDPQGSYEVEPQFYITESSFSYGSEITGPEYLGKPVDGLTLGPDQQFQFNIRLNARSQALQSMIRGLAYFSIRDYDSAADEFQSAVNTPYWEPDEGQEVAYFLLGTVRLRAWDLIQNPEALPLASAAFEKARQINPNYVRNYLSLGAVAIARAQVPNKAGNGIGAVNKEDLLEGISWYSAGLNQTEPAQAYIPVKAAFGLGQAYLLGFEFKVIDNSQEQAAQYFQQVVTAYQNEKMPQDLDWFAAHAHAGLGRLAALNQDWETMSNEYRQAAAILEGMESNPPQLWIARFQAMAGFAEMKQNHLDRARQYYSNAIKTGSGTVPEADLKSWQDALDQIEKEEP